MRTNRQRVCPGIILICASFFSTLSPAADPLPGETIDLSCWKLTLPVDTNHAGKPDEIQPNELRTFVLPDYFFVSPDGKSVVFRARCDGVTTRGSKFPRCELREANRVTGRGVSWSTDDTDPHVMKLRLAITQTPQVKKHVVCAQIHDADDDLMMVRLEGHKLFVERNGLEEVTLNDNYQLGTVIDVEIKAAAGEVTVSYNNIEKMRWKISRDGCFFKTGVYTQSNVARGDQANAYGEVTIHAVEVQ